MQSGECSGSYYIFCIFEYTRYSFCIIFLNPLPLLTPVLFLPVLPHITPFEFESELNTGDNVQLNCHVSKGDIPLKITWSLNDEPIGTSLGITTLSIGSRTNLLNINSVDREHAGLYTCTASNKGGTASHSATLFIDGTFHFCMHL